MKLETAVKPLPVDSTILVRSRSALGLKYVELTKGTSTKGYDEGATIPLKAATPAPVEFDEFLSTFDEQDARRRPEAAGGLRQRARRPRPGPQPGDPVRSTRCCSTLGPAMANLADDRTKLAACPRRWAARRRSSRRSPRTRPRSSRNLDTTFTRVRRDRAPVPAGQRSAAGRRRCRPRSRSCPSSARSWPTARASSATCARASRRCRAPRLTSPTRSRSASRRCAAPSRFNKRLGADLRSAAALRRGPAGRARRPGPRRHRADRQPAAGDARADPDGLQLLDAALPQRSPRC